MQHSSTAVRPVEAGQVGGYQSVIDQGGTLEHLAPILLLGVIILVARWLTRRPRREADGRWPWR